MSVPNDLAREAVEWLAVEPNVLAGDWEFAFCKACGVSGFREVTHHDDCLHIRCAYWLAAEKMMNGLAEGSIMQTNSAPTTDTTIDELHDTLRFLRKDLRGITFAELAEETGLSISYLCDIERGRTVPRLATLSLIVAALRAPLRILVAE